jgi:hypothetical protein
MDPLGDPCNHSPKDSPGEHPTPGIPKVLEDWKGGYGGSPSGSPSGIPYKGFPRASPGGLGFTCSAPVVHKRPSQLKKACGAETLGRPSPPRTIC